MRARFYRIAFTLGLFLSLTWAGAASAWQVDTFPLESHGRSGFWGLAMDKSGMPWVLANGLVQYFDGREFVALDKGRLSGEQFVTGLYGGPERGVYLTQRGDKDQLGKIFRLEDGQCEEVTTFYYESWHDPPGIYVSQDGRLFNWGPTYLAVYDGEHWKRVEGEFDRRSRTYPPAICDLGDDVYFYSTDDNRIYHCNAKSVLDSMDGPKDLGDALAAHKQKNMYPVPPLTTSWNGDRVLVFFHRSSLRFAFNVRTAEPIELNLVPKEGQRFGFVDFTELRDGSVLLISHISGLHEYALYKLTADGEISELPGSRVFNWANSNLRSNPHSFLEASDGTLVLGSPQFGFT
ncbi:hypothetical protein, partial [Blastopirellula marina]